MPFGTKSRFLSSGILTLAMCLSAVATAAGEWSLETIGDTGTLGWRVRMVKDGFGRIHVASFESGNDSFYTSREPVTGTWDEPLILSGGFRDLALDQNDRPHILARESGQAILYHLDDSGVWQQTILPFASPAGLSMDFDSQHRLHVSYSDTAAEALKHAIRNGTEWTITTVTTGPKFRFSNSFTSISLDNNDAAHFLWYVATPSLEHAYWNGSGYSFDTIDYGDGWSMAFDQKNHLHVAYHGGSDQMHALSDGTSWTVQAVDEERQALSCAIALDSEGNPHIVYLIGGQPNWGIEHVRLATLNGTEWEIEQIDEWDSTTSGPEAQDILVDSLGHIHVVYSDDDKNLNYATTQHAAPCDLTGDNTINASDLALLLDAWGPNPGHPADLNGDGMVDAFDLAELLGRWGDCA